MSGEKRTQVYKEMWMIFNTVGMKDALDGIMIALSSLSIVQNDPILAQKDMREEILISV